MTKVKSGDKIKIHYTGKFTDNTVFDSTVASEPFEFTIGVGEVIKGMDEGLIGMEIGESKTINIKPDMAYGDVHKDLIFEVDKKEVFEDMEIEVGQKVQIPQEEEEALIVEITKITDDIVIMDGNHPLAGKEIVFDIQLLEIK